MHRQLPDLLGMGIFYLLDELRLIHIVEHQIPLFCAHYQILIPRQYYKAQNVHLLNVLLLLQVLVQGDHISTETVSDSTSKELSGDLQIRGSNVFKCYYGRDEATKKEFTDDMREPDVIV